MNRAVFLDRDGVINRKVPEPGYVTSWDQMHLLPAAVMAIPLFNRADFRVIVVTNQRCVAKGLLTVPELESIHVQMCSDLASAGANIDAIYYCPHEENACSCRKPAPGMLLTAAREYNIDLGASWMIGDSAADVQAGKSAGCKTVLLGADGRMSSSVPDITSESLLDAAHEIVQRGSCPGRL